MSNGMKSLLLSKIKKYNLLKNLKPAEKNNNYNYIDNISYNIIENMTMFKNNEINKQNLSIRLICNLSLFLSKGKIDQKKIKNKKNDNNIYSNNNLELSIKNFDIYIPSNRIPCLEDINNKKINNIRIPFSSERIQTFFPLGRDFLYVYNNGREIKKNVQKNIKYSSNEIIYKDNSLKESFGNKSNNSYSLSNENIDFLLEKDIINGNNNKIKFKNIPIFKKYRDLVDYIECPLIRKDSVKEEYDNYIKLLNNIDKLFENEENNEYNYKNNLINGAYTDDQININNYKKIYIDNFEVYNIINRNQSKSNKSSKIYDDKNYISENTLNNISSNLNILNKDIFSSSLKKRYLKIMNEQYISLIYKIYIRLNNIEKSLFIDNIYKKKLFLQFFKKFILEIGISDKIHYEKILKNQVYNNKLLSFNQFIQCFDTIICANDYENLKIKFLYLLSIIYYSNDNYNNNEYLNEKQIALFFELLSCNITYVENFCENLGDELVIRYNIIYNNSEKENIIKDLYKFRKMKIVLESFFDEIQNEE